jgi:predicted ester cyclase
MLTPTLDREQDMSGFPDRYADIVDYIVRITREIWIDGAVGLIYDTYDPNCVIYTAGDVGRGVESVVQSTIASMASFPDLDNHFLNVAWSGDSGAGFYTSHLGFGTGINVGHSIYGPATGRAATIRFCADCVTLDGRIHTEWLARDNGALVRQLGLDLHETARHLSQSSPRELYTRAAPSRLNGQSPPDVLDHPRETLQDHFRHLFHDLWNRRRFDLMAEHYTPDVRIHTAGARVATGIPSLRALHVALLASMPDASLTIGHICWSDEVDGVIVAVRWELAGTARSGGWFGQVPDGVPIFVPGMTHCRLNDNCLVVEEWTVFDEVAVLAQLYRSAS